MTKGWKKGKYQILALREFEHDHIFDEKSCLSVIVGDQEVAGATDVKRVIVRHVAILRIKKWLFRDALCILYGKAAAALKEDAVEAGVFYFGDPGRNRRDRHGTTSYDLDFRWSGTSDSSMKKGKFWWKNQISTWTNKANVYDVYFY